MDRIRFVRQMRPEVRLTLAYFIAGFIWILLSDQFLVLLLNGTPGLLTSAQTYKGWLFVFVTSGLLYILLQREFQRRREIEERLAEDVAEIKKLQRDSQEKVRLQMALDRETEARDLRRRFMAMLSHEFRTPLTAIFSSADLLDHYDDRLSPEARKSRYHEIRQQVERTIEMLDDFLMMMRAESVGPQYNPAPVDLVEFCRTVVQDFEHPARNRHTLRFSTSADSAMIHADEQLLRHALGNLISNAIKYSPEGGSITVELECDSQQCRIHVRDQGIGIPPQDLQHLFEIFQRASNVGRIPGTGLGLAIAGQAVELHGGSMEVKSAVGRGSTFTMHLPLKYTDPDLPEQPS